MVVISANDKSVPAHLLAIARCDLPAVHVPGGTQLNAPDYVTSDEMWPMGAEVRRGVYNHLTLPIGRISCFRHGAEVLSEEPAQIDV